MKNLLSAISITIGILISACSTKTGEVWVAAEGTPVYASANDAETRELFTLFAGDSCIPLRSVFEKVYLHTEIQCENGRGWVIDQQNFNITSAS